MTIFHWWVALFKNSRMQSRKRWWRNIRDDVLAHWKWWSHSWINVPEKPSVFALLPRGGSTPFSKHRDNIIIAPHFLWWSQRTSLLQNAFEIHMVMMQVCRWNHLGRAAGALNRCRTPLLIFCALLANTGQTLNPCNMSWYLGQCTSPTFQKAPHKNKLIYMLPTQSRRKSLNRAH